MKEMAGGGESHGPGHVVTDTNNINYDNHHGAPPATDQIMHLTASHPARATVQEISATLSHV